MTSEPCRSDEETRALVDSYREFRLSNDASPRVIKHRYRLLAKKWHPDKHTDRLDSLAVAKEKMRAINASYARIKDAPLRGRGARTTHSSGRTPHRPPRAESAPEWERACPNCGAVVRIRGDRYAHCYRCDVGFFPTHEGPFQQRAPLTLLQRVALVVAGAFIALSPALTPLMATILAAVFGLVLVAWSG